MSMELHVFSDRQLGSIAEWQREIDTEGFPLQLAADVDLASAEGLVPAVLEGRQTGFECLHDDAAEALDNLGKKYFDRRWRFALGLRWLGSRMDELFAAWMAATAYARATDGVIFDYEEGRVFQPHEAAEFIRRIERNRSRIDVEAMNAEILRRVLGDS
jgi:hypothetical protein